MFRMNPIVWFAILGVAAPSALGQDLDLSWNTIDGGGRTSVSGSLSLSGTIGQPDAGQMTAAMPGHSFTLLGGFWTPCPGDLNGDRRIGLTDLTILLAHFGVASGARPEDGDLDRNGQVNLVDLTHFLARFGEGC